MNKVILMGRLTRDPEVRYSKGVNPVAIANYSLAVRRQFKREGEPDVDFINIVSFAKSAEFAEKYFKKGQQVAVTGRLQLSNWEDKDGVKRLNVEVVAEEQHFAESKGAEATKSEPAATTTSGFQPINERLSEDEDLPF